MTIETIKEAANRKIWVSFQKEGIHCYPAAATDPALATGDEYDVSFLGTPHRHIFHFRDSKVGYDIKNNLNPDLTRPAMDLSLNYVPIVYPQYTPAWMYVKYVEKEGDKQQFWRVVNSCSVTMLNLTVEYDGVVQPMVCQYVLVMLRCYIMVCVPWA